MRLIDLPSETMLAFVRSVVADQFIAHLEPEFTMVHQIDVSSEPGPFTFEGLSGGPVFLVPSSSVLLVPRLCGIVKEGGALSAPPDRLVVFYAPLDRLERDGSLR